MTLLGVTVQLAVNSFSVSLNPDGKLLLAMLSALLYSPFDFLRRHVACDRDAQVRRMPASIDVIS